jgi:hypothetical protein
MFYKLQMNKADKDDFNERKHSRYWNHEKQRTEKDKNLSKFLHTINIDEYSNREDIRHRLLIEVNKELATNDTITHDTEGIEYEIQRYIFQVEVSRIKIWNGEEF